MRRFFKNLKKKCFISKFENLAENSHFCSFLDPSSIKGLYRGTINPQGPINGHMNFSKHILDWSKWQKTEFQKFIIDLDGDFFPRMTPFQLTVHPWNSPSMDLSILSPFFSFLNYDLRVRWHEKQTMKSLHWKLNWVGQNESVNDSWSPKHLI